MNEGNLLKCFFFGVLCLTLSGSAFAENAADTLRDYSQYNNRIQAIVGENYPGYTLMDTIFGDLNLDEEADCVVVLQKEQLINETAPDAASDRKTLLLISENGVLHVAASNDYIIDCSNCGGAGVGDPYVKPVINKGSICFGSLYGACNKTRVSRTFHYNESLANWELYMITLEDYSCNFEGDEPEIKTVTKTPKDFGCVLFRSFK